MRNSRNDISFRTIHSGQHITKLKQLLYMRPIKFRAWIKSKKLFYAVMMIDWSEEELHNGGNIVKLDDAILNQFTGLHDKHGKEIYEGDVVKICGYDAIGYVYWKDVAFWIKEIRTCVDSDTTWSGSMAEEVIGNVYEHHHLLDVKNLMGTNES